MSFLINAMNMLYTGYEGVSKLRDFYNRGPEGVKESLKHQATPKNVVSGAFLATVVGGALINPTTRTALCTFLGISMQLSNMTLTLLMLGIYTAWMGMKGAGALAGAANGAMQVASSVLNSPHAATVPAAATLGGANQVASGVLSSSNTLSSALPANEANSTQIEANSATLGQVLENNLEQNPTLMNPNTMVEEFENSQGANPSEVNTSDLVPELKKESIEPSVLQDNLEQSHGLANPDNMVKEFEESNLAHPLEVNNPELPQGQRVEERSSTSKVSEQDLKFFEGLENALEDLEETEGMLTPPSALDAAIEALEDDDYGINANIGGSTPTQTLENVESIWKEAMELGEESLLDLSTPKPLSDTVKSAVPFSPTHPSLDMNTMLKDFASFRTGEKWASEFASVLKGNEMAQEFLGSESVSNMVGEFITDQARGKNEMIRNIATGICVVGIAAVGVHQIYKAFKEEAPAASEDKISYATIASKELPRDEDEDFYSLSFDSTDLSGD